MKKLPYITSLSSILAFGLIIAPANSEAATAKTFKNCTELNKIYKGGVAKDTKVKNVGGKTKYTPTISADLYTLNSQMDRDKDGIACEK